MRGNTRTAAEPVLTSRRSFLCQTTSCGAYLLAAFAAGPAFLRRAFAASQKFDVVASEAFGRLEQVAEWEKIVEELEELDDLRAYDEAKAGSEDAVPFEQAVREIREGSGS